MRTPHRSGPDASRGDTLIELLVATAILGLAVTALVGALAGSASTSVADRSTASLDAILKSFAETATYDIQLDSTVARPEYRPCATAGSYQIVSTPSPARGSAGTAVTIFAAGFAPDAPIQLTVRNESFTTGNYMSRDRFSSYPRSGSFDRAGDATITFEIPPSGGAFESVQVSDGGRTGTSQFVLDPGDLATAVAPLADYRVGISTVQWWNTATESFDTSSGCPGPAYMGMQLLTATAVAPDGTQARLQFLVSNPNPVPPGTAREVNAGGIYELTAAGYPRPSFTLDSSLPHSGLSVNPSGALSGPPGRYLVTLTVSNAAGSRTQYDLPVEIDGIAITSADTATFTAGKGGTFTVTTSSYPAPPPYPSIADSRWKGCTPSLLPPGISFSDQGDGTASIDVTGDAPGGAYVLCLSATSTFGTALQELHVTVGYKPSIISAGQDGVTASTGGSFQVVAVGVPPPDITNASFPGCRPDPLPQGVAFTPGTGTADIEVARNARSGVYTLCLTASNGFGTATQPFTLTVGTGPAFDSPSDWTLSPKGGVIDVSTTGDPPATIGDTGFGSCQQTAPNGVLFRDLGNGTATLTFPDPTPAGAYTLCLTASNGVAPDAQQALTVAVGTAPAVTGPRDINFTDGRYSSYTFAVRGVPAPSATSTSTPTLPSDVQFDPASGSLSGIPTAADNGSYSVTITATNAIGSVTFPVTLDISNRP